MDQGCASVVALAWSVQLEVLRAYIQVGSIAAAAFELRISDPMT